MASSATFGTTSPSLMQLALPSAYDIRRHQTEIKPHLETVKVDRVQVPAVPYEQPIEAGSAVGYDALLVEARSIWQLHRGGRLLVTGAVLPSYTQLDFARLREQIS